MKPVLIMIAIFAGWAFGAAASTDRVALIIGNGAYAHQAPLANPKNDIAAMEKTLTSIGFAVTVFQDLDEDGMERALADFSEVADQAEVALVYYSGHGMEISETNYLIPVDAELRKARDARFEAVDLESVRASIEGAKKLKVVILDACRDNTFLPTTRGGTRGMKRVVAAAGEVIAYSTAPGSVAQDGEPGGMSPYTRALSEKLIESPDMDVRFLFTSLGAKTAEYAGVAQRPYTEFASILPDGSLPLGVRLKSDEDDAFEAAIAAGDVETLRRLVERDPTHPRTPDALAVIRETDARRAEAVISAALTSNRRDALENALRIGGDHPKIGEVTAALALHKKIDFAVSALDADQLDEVYKATDERHPRRRDIRTALRSAIVNEACGRFISYSMACPPALFEVAGPRVEAAAPEPEPEPTPQVEAKPPADPIEELTQDVTADALAKAAAVKIEWRQIALQSLGYYQSAIDGAIGPGMRRAVNAWRAELGVAGGGDLSPREIVALMKQGAERDSLSKAYLGVMYGIGLGVALDPERSRALLTEARDAGVADAAAYLKNLSANWKN